MAAVRLLLGAWFPVSADTTADFAARQQLEAQAARHMQQAREAQAATERAAAQAAALRANQGR